MKHVLFICGRNRRRSPTAEAIFNCWPGIEVASAGLNSDADSPVTPEDLAWANLIFVMEPAHRRKLSTRFRGSIRDQQVVCLNIPDRFEFMQPQLVELLTKRVSPHLPRPLTRQ